MSWYRSITIEVETGIHTVESEIRKITHADVKTTNPSSAPSPEDVSAAKQAAVILAKSIMPPPGTILEVAVHGHTATDGAVSAGDSVSASVYVRAKPEPTPTL